MHKQVLYILLIGASFLPTATHAQQIRPFNAPTGHIAGRVLSADEKSVPYATVELKGTHIAATTHEDGTYVITAPAGAYTLIVQYVGTDKQTLPVSIQAGQTTQQPPIHLAEKAGQLSEIVVTGQYTPQSLRNSVYRVRTISQERIRLRGATDVLGVLNNELGVRFSTDQTLGETDIQLMGLSGQEVKVLLDGVPLIDRGATKQSLSQIDINTIDRIEIVEGPLSVMYGTDALAGVINIITKKPAPGSNQLSVHARIQEETAGKEYNGFTDKGIHQENLGINWQHNNWNLGGAITRNNSGGWQGDTTGRAKEWMPKDQWLANGTIGYRTSHFSASYRLDYLDETLKSLGNYFPPNYKTTDAHYITNRYTHIAQLSWQANSLWSVNGSLSYQNYQRRTQTTDYNVQTGQRTLNLNEGAQDTSTFKTWFARATTQYLASTHLSLQGGLEFKQDRTTGQRISGSPIINDYALFVSGEYKPTPGINIRPGVRLSKNSIYDAPPVIPSLNTRFTLGHNLDLRASYARGFRAPSLRELYFDFHDASHDINGNPNLKAEYSNSFNTSLTWQAINKKNMRLTTTLAGFYNDYHNFINLAIGANNQYYYFNTDRYKTTGGTLENTFSYKTLQATLGFSYIGTYNKYANDTTYTKQASMHSFTWSPELTANISWQVLKQGLQLGFFYKLTGRQPSYELVTVNQQEVIQLAKTGAFSMADFTATQPVGKFLSVNAGVKNLFNVTKISNNSQDLGGAHSTGGPILKAYGRSYFLGLNFQWSKH